MMDGQRQREVVGAAADHVEAVERAFDQIEGLVEMIRGGSEQVVLAAFGKVEFAVSQRRLGRGAHQLHRTFFARQDRGPQHFLPRDDQAHRVLAECARERTADIEQRADGVTRIGRWHGRRFPQFTLRESQRHQPRLSAGQPFLEPGTRVVRHVTNRPRRRRGPCFPCCRPDVRDRRRRVRRNRFPRRKFPPPQARARWRPRSVLCRRRGVR